MSLIFWRGDSETRDTAVSESHPLPTQTIETMPESPTIRELLTRNIDVAAWLAAEGRAFYASDADQNDLVTAQTSFADTTPTFMLRVPSGTTCIPLLASLGQTGTVAGDTISAIVEIDNIDRYSTGGTTETVFNSRTYGSIANKCTLLTGATALTGYGIRVMGINVAQDVAPAEGISNEVIWTPSGPDFLVGPATFLVYTYAATTAPTWFWTFKWVEFPTARLGFNA